MLQAQKSVHAGITTYGLIGIINEATNFDGIIDKEAIVLTLDLALVSHINSTGVKSFMAHLTKLSLEGKTIRLSRCSPAIVEQINLVPNFASGAKVESICLPYFCDACAKDLCLVQVVSNIVTIHSIENEVECPTCKSKAVFDDVVEDYLQFALRK